MNCIFNKRASVLFISLIVFLLDQLVKFVVVAKIPLTVPPTIVFNLFGDFFQIIHVRNTGALFSLGSQWSDIFQILLLRILPTIVIGWLAVVISLTPEQQARIFRLKKVPAEEFNLPSRRAAALIVGGGLGNIVDRLFRSAGVVDFLDFKFYGIFGLERWPTFNIADASVVIGISLLILFSFISKDS